MSVLKINLLKEISLSGVKKHADDVQQEFFQLIIVHARLPLSRDMRKHKKK